MVCCHEIWNSVYRNVLKYHIVLKYHTIFVSLENIKLSKNHFSFVFHSYFFFKISLQANRIDINKKEVNKMYKTVLKDKGYPSNFFGADPLVGCDKP